MPLHQLSLLLDHTVMSSLQSRRKQTKPRRITEDADIKHNATDINTHHQHRQQHNNNTSTTPTNNDDVSSGEAVEQAESSVDSHVCGRCCTQFFKLDDFVDHKRTCCVTWPSLAKLLTPEEKAQAQSTNEHENNNSISMKSTSTDAVDLSVKRANSTADCQQYNQPEEQVLQEPIKTALNSLQEQQLKQLQLIQHLCSKVLTNGNPDSQTSAFLSPPDSDESKSFNNDHAKSEESSGKAISACCAMCDETFASKARLLWHIMDEHGMDTPFRCDICDETFSDRGKLRYHSREHRLTRWLEKSRPRSILPLAVSKYREETEEGRKSMPIFDEAEEEALNSLIEDSIGDSPSNDEGGATPFSDISSASAGRLWKANERPLDLTSVNQLFMPTNVQELSRPFQMPGRAGMSPFRSGPLAVPSSDDRKVDQVAQLTGVLSNNSEMMRAEEDWESMMEISNIDENEKIRQLVGDKAAPVTDPNQCLICRRILSCKSALQMHYRTHTGERPFKCRICLRAFTTKGNLKTHMGVHRSKHPFRMHHQCPICQKRFLNAMLLQQHVRLHTRQLSNTPAATCLQSQNSSTSAMAMQAFNPSHRFEPNGPVQALAYRLTLDPQQEEKQAKQENDQHKCSEPTTPIPAQPQAMQPSAQQTPISAAANPFNPVFAAQMTNMIGHPSTTCNICFKMFACNSALEIHYRSHTKERPFRCHVCNRGFSTKGNMKQHLLTHKIRDMHSNEGSQAPSQCSPEPTEGDINDTSINGSVSSVDTTRTQNNASIGEKLLNQVTVKTEPVVNTDNGIKPSPLDAIQRMWAQTEPVEPRKPPVLSKHQCGVCFKHFSSSSALQIHMRTHTGDKPFKCTVCARAFTTKGNLKVHMGTHMWQNPSRRGRRIFDFPDGGQLGVVQAAGSISSGEEADHDGRQSPKLNGATGNRDDDRPNTDVRANPMFSPFSAGFPPMNMMPGFGMTALGMNPHLSLPAMSASLPFSAFPFSTAPQLLSTSSPAFSLATSQQQQQGISSLLKNATDTGVNSSVDNVMWMWKKMCMVCQKVCDSPSQLEEHLKLHLAGGSRFTENPTVA